MKPRRRSGILPLPAAAVVLVSAAAASAFPGTMAAAQDSAAPTAGTGPAAAAPTIRVVTLDGVRALKARTVVAAAAKAAVGKPGERVVIQAATKAVTALYRERGYPVAQVVDAEVTPEGVLRLTIVEGRVRRIVVRGNKKTRTGTILEALGTRQGDAYNENGVRDDRNRLARLGLFNDVTVTAQVPGAVDEPLPGAEPDEGDKTRGSGGDPATAPPPAAGQAGAKSGAPTGGVGQTAPAAGGTVVTLPVPPPAPATPPAEPAGPVAAAPLPPDEDRVGDVDLVVRVQERQTANIAATVGYSDAIGAVGFVDLSELNLGGRAQRVGAQWQRASSSFFDPNGNLQRGDSRQAYNFSYERPALGLRSTALSLNLYNQNTVFLPYFTGANYTIRTFEKRNGATARVGRALGRNLTGYLTARHDQVGYDFFALQNQYLGDGSDITPFTRMDLVQAANGRVGALGMVLVADRRDAADNPRRGFLNSLTLEDSNRLLGGNRLFRQATLDLRQYLPLTTAKKGPVFAARVMLGLSSGDVPLPEQYFLGGFDTLRGYELFSVYGDRMITGSAEVRAPVSAGVVGVGFIDVGNAWTNGQKLGSGGVKAGIGAGLRFLSPIGPIRFDAAYGDRFRTYVSLGQSF
jgi:outer membrane protein assembly factor BamA